MNYHKAKLEITNKVEPQKKESNESFYVQFVKTYARTLVSNTSSMKGKIFAAEMLGGFVKDQFLVELLEQALEKYKNEFLLAQTLERALNGDFLLPEEDEYEKFLRESGLKKELYLNQIKEKAEMKAEYAQAGKEAIETLKYRAAAVKKS